MEMDMSDRDMSGSAYCIDCHVRAVHERGLGTPLVIRHKPDCPNADHRPSTDELLGIAPDWTGDLTTDEYIARQRRR